MVRSVGLAIVVAVGHCMFMDVSVAQGVISRPGGESAPTVKIEEAPMPRVVGTINYSEPVKDEPRRTVEILLPPNDKPLPRLIHASTADAEDYARDKVKFWERVCTPTMIGKTVGGILTQEAFAALVADVGIPFVKLEEQVPAPDSTRIGDHCFKQYLCDYRPAAENFLLTPFVACVGDPCSWECGTAVDNTVPAPIFKWIPHSICSWGMHCAPQLGRGSNRGAVAACESSLLKERLWGNCVRSRTGPISPSYSYVAY